MSTGFKNNFIQKKLKIENLLKLRFSKIGSMTTNSEKNECVWNIIEKSTKIIIRLSGSKISLEYESDNEKKKIKDLAIEEIVPQIEKINNSKNEGVNYKDNTPTYNVNRDVVNFKDFNPEKEEVELKSLKKSYKKNELEKGQRERKYKFNKVTRKQDDLDKLEVEDKLNAIKESNEQLGKYNISLKSIKDYYNSDRNDFELHNYIIETNKSGIKEFVYLMDLSEHIEKYTIKYNGKDQVMGDKWTSNL